MKWVRDYIGLPFAEKGRSMEGCDCYGLIRLIWERECGIRLPEYVTEYSSTVDRKVIARALAEFGHTRDEWAPVKAGEEKEFDAILMRMMGQPMHVGMVVEPGKMIHIESGHNAVLEPYRVMKWEHRLVGFWRHETLA